MSTIRTYPTTVRAGLPRLVGMRISNFEALVPYTTTNSFICALLNPNSRVASPPSKHCRMHGSRASLLRPSTTSAVCARTLTALTLARRLAESDGANYNKMNRLALSSGDEDEGGSTSGVPSWPATPEPDTERQQPLSPPSPGDHAPRGGLA